MKSKFFKVLSLITTLSLLSASCVFPAEASQTVSEIDSFLLNIGTPQSVIDNMDQDLKQTIYDTSLENSKEKEFAGIETNSYTIPTDNESGITPYYIPPSDFSVTVVAFKESNYNGYVQYSIYSSFEWKKEVHIKDDAFSFVLPTGWELVPGKKNLRIQVYNIYKEKWEVATDISTPYAADFSGYGFNGFGNTCKVSAKYKGTGYTYAYKKVGNVSNQIKVGYAHENSAGGVHLPGSISIGLGPFSISFTGSFGMNVITFEDIFGF